MIQRVEQGNTPEQQSGGQGVSESLLTPNHRRETAIMLQRALRSCKRVTADPTLWGPIVEALELGASDRDDPRGAARCAQVLATLRAQNLDVMKHLDKNDRLDDGKPTENHDHRVFTATFDRLG